MCRLTLNNSNMHSNGLGPFISPLVLMAFALTITNIYLFEWSLVCGGQMLNSNEDTGGKISKIKFENFQQSQS